MVARVGVTASAGGSIVAYVERNGRETMNPELHGIPIAGDGSRWTRAPSRLPRRPPIRLDCRRGRKAKGQPPVKVAVVGSGVVGEALADGFLKHGADVMRASRNPAKLMDWKAKAGETARTGSLEEAVEYGEVVVLAVKGTTAESVVKALGAERLAGKLVIDVTSPLADASLEDGASPYFAGIRAYALRLLET